MLQAGEWNRISAMSNSESWNLRAPVGHLTDTTLAFCELDLLMADDAKWALGVRRRWAGIGKACFASCGSDTWCSPLQKRSLGCYMNSPQEMEKGVLYILLPDRWQSKWSCQNSPLKNTDLEEQPWIQHYLVDWFPRNGSFENFSLWL